MKQVLTTSLCVLLLAMVVRAHDMFLKFDSFFLAPNAQVEVRLLNGVFDKSENVILRERMRDVSILGPGGLSHPAESDWRDDDTTSVLRLRTGGPGTYVVGTSTRPSQLSMTADDFNEYLKLEGVIDTFAERKKLGQLGVAATERYSKHVKAIYQVGDARTDTYRTPLGYPVEMVPQQNPYQLKIGDTLAVLCLRDGKPVANQYVLYGVEAPKAKYTQLETRSDKDGVVRVPLTGAGRWYLKYIHMTPINEPPVNYESRWASLTFEVK